MAAAVYVLCALTSLTCAVLLLRGYSQRRVRLLLWSGVGFVWFALANAMLVVDQLILPERDLQLWRDLPTFAGVMVLVYGLVWDTYDSR
jgi:drug/metabolite transporter (DMT)-like permease